jgi:hypothetical protein
LALKVLIAGADCRSLFGGNIGHAQKVAALSEAVGDLWMLLLAMSIAGQWVLHGVLILQVLVQRAWQ